MISLTKTEELDFKNSEGDILLFEGNHYVIKSAPQEPITDPLEIANFDPSDPIWKTNFQLFSAQTTNNPGKL